MRNVYKTIIRPHLEYCAQLWSPPACHGNWATIIELIKSPEGLKVTSIEVFLTLILNHQHDLHAIYHIVARNCLGCCIYSAFEGKRTCE